MNISQETRALVTGANGGIGRAIAALLAQRGATVIASGRRADMLEPLRKELGAELLLADLIDRSDVERVAQSAANCDLVILNAALPASGPVQDFESDHIDRALDVNLRAPMQIARIAGVAMAQRGRGHIVFISSISGKVASGHSAVYSATKFGLRGFAIGFRNDLRLANVGVSSVFPGFIRDAGMFANTGVKLPSGVGTRTPREVAAAVVRAVEANVAEIDVAAFEQRLGGWIAHFAPDFVASLQRAFGGEGIAAQISAGQRAKR